ncbi:Uncharacterized protein APZ42_028024 [Daphnia magna]|uniref:Uncharacterized protein n=1 Tax=Daphnia magna TaxID=35525 RepID=A0A164QWA6_9CRUS|nr:Uncharacterized protein APZ42_028024 [Daphnia magna]
MNNNHHFQLLMMFKHTHTQKAELQELDSQILLTQGQGSCGQGSTMMLMNMNTPPAPMSPPVHHSQQSSTVSNSLGGSVVGGNGNIVGGNHHSSTLGSQPSSIGSSNGYDLINIKEKRRMGIVRPTNLKGGWGRLECDPEEEGVSPRL